jgi:hypothetical protein
MTDKLEINWIRPNNNSDGEAIVKGRRHAYHVVIEHSETMPPYCWLWTVQTENHIYKHGTAESQPQANRDAIDCVKEIEKKGVE